MGCNSVFLLQPVWLVAYLFQIVSVFVTVDFSTCMLGTYNRYYVIK